MQIHPLAIGVLWRRLAFIFKHLVPVFMGSEQETGGSPFP